MPRHSEIKANIIADQAATHARINEDVRKIQEHPDYPDMPSMLRCYVDILILDVELLQKRAEHAQDHIDRLDALLDTYIAQP